MSGGSRLAGRDARADAVIVAAGSSRRMGGIDKLTARVGGRELLAWTVAAFDLAPAVERIVVVTAPGAVEALRAAPWLPASVVAVVEGGTRRQESVALGVAALDALDAAESPAGGQASPAGRGDARVVLVHDGARPAVTVDLIGRVAAAAAEHGAAIPVLQVAETVKRVEDGRVIETVDRSTLATAQTPQGVRRRLLREAWAACPPGGAREFTDEAALLEACRIPVHTITGDPRNLKVTMPDDLSRAAAILGVPAAVRFGIGSDRHPFGPGGPLALGGVEFPDAPRLFGHSDGDAALHALADALLGAAGLGDLGRLFPADQRTPRGIASRDLLTAVVVRLAEVGLRPAWVDLTITTARPRLAGRLDEMRGVIAGILGIDAGAVNVKAATGNLGGDEGAGRAVSAQAIAGVEPIGGGPAAGGPQ